MTTHRMPNQNAATYPYEPDEAIAPGETLREWLEWSHLSPRVAASMVAPPLPKSAQRHVQSGDVPDAYTAIVAMLEAVLANTVEITEPEALILWRITNVRPAFWLALQHNYTTLVAKLAAEDRDLAPPPPWTFDRVPDPSPLPPPSPLVTPSPVS